jgi:hypothetical protein
VPQMQGPAGAAQVRRQDDAPEHQREVTGLSTSSTAERALVPVPCSGSAPELLNKPGTPAGGLPGFVMPTPGTSAAYPHSGSGRESAPVGLLDPIAGGFWSSVEVRLQCARRPGRLQTARSRVRLPPQALASRGPERLRRCRLPEVAARPRGSARGRSPGTPCRVLRPAAARLAFSHLSVPLEGGQSSSCEATSRFRRRLTPGR